eukprot:Rmarinus@m.17880
MKTNMGAFFHNTKTKASQREHPTDSYFKNLYKTAKARDMSKSRAPTPTKPHLTPTKSSEAPEELSPKLKTPKVQSDAPEIRSQSKSPNGVTSPSFAKSCNSVRSLNTNGIVKPYKPLCDDPNDLLNDIAVDAAISDEDDSSCKELALSDDLAGGDPREGIEGDGTVLDDSSTNDDTTSARLSHVNTESTVSVRFARTQILDKPPTSPRAKSSRTSSPTPKSKNRWSRSGTVWDTTTSSPQSVPAESTATSPAQSQAHLTHSPQAEEMVSPEVLSTDTNEKITTGVHQSEVEANAHTPSEQAGFSFETERELGNSDDILPSSMHSTPAVKEVSPSLSLRNSSSDLAVNVSDSTFQLHPSPRSPTGVVPTAAKWQRTLLDTYTMADFLGINPFGEYWLMWIAKAAAQHPSPSSYWVSYTGDSGESYYRHMLTGKVTHAHPSAPYFGILTKIERTLVGPASAEHYDRKWIEFHARGEQAVYYNLIDSGFSTALPDEPVQDAVYASRRTVAIQSYCAQLIQTYYRRCRAARLTKQPGGIARCVRMYLDEQQKLRDAQTLENSVAVASAIPPLLEMAGSGAEMTNLKPATPHFVRAKAAMQKALAEAASPIEKSKKSIADEEVIPREITAERDPGNQEPVMSIMSSTAPSKLETSVPSSHAKVSTQQRRMPSQRALPTPFPKDGSATGTVTFDDWQRKQLLSKNGVRRSKSVPKMRNETRSNSKARALDDSSNRLRTASPSYTRSEVRTLHTSHSTPRLNQKPRLQQSSRNRSTSSPRLNPNPPDRHGQLNSCAPLNSARRVELRKMQERIRAQKEEEFKVKSVTDAAESRRAREKRRLARYHSSTFPDREGLAGRSEPNDQHSPASSGPSLTTVAAQPLQTWSEPTKSSVPVVRRSVSLMALIQRADQESS